MSEVTNQILQRDFQIISDLFEPDPDPGRWPIHPNSSLAKDDSVTKGFDPISSQFEGLIHSAMDNLHGVKSMIVDAGAIHTFAEYAMIRAGIETSATAWWLLAPASRQERCTRSLRIFWKDACDGGTALEGSTAGVQYKERRLTHLKAVAAKAGIEEGAAKRHPSATGVLRELDERHGLAALLVWRASSGMVHGRRWSTFALSDLEHHDSLRSPDMVHVRITGNMDRLAMSYHIGCLVLQEAMRLFHMRREPPTCRV
ncbi:hypothetical protein [Pedococcus dokdonensis]|nr:hypothetical protein [Pedococcus dokdonensis]